MADAAVSTVSNDDSNQPDNEAIVQIPAVTVNGLSMNDSNGKILVPATQYNPHETSVDGNSDDNLIIDETAASECLNEDSLREQNVDGDEYDDNEIIPETQYAPDHVSNDGGSRPISRGSSRNSFGHDANEKRVTFAFEAENSMNLVEEKTSINGGGSDEGDELIDVNQDTNNSWPAIGDGNPIDASQAVIGHLDTELLGDVGSSACHNDRLTDSISLSSTYVGNASKTDVEALNMPAVKTNEKSEPTGQAKEPNANTPETSFSSCRETERSTSTTPDLEMFSTPIVSTSTSTAFSTSKKARTSTPDLFAAKASQANNVSDTPNDIDERPATPDSFITSDAAPSNKLSNVVDAMAATTNDDSYSNDNELFGACTQVFPPPPKVISSKKAANTSSASELNEEEPDHHHLEPNQTDDVAMADGKSLEIDNQPVENVVDENEDSNDMYAAQTQMYPMTLAPPSTNRVSERVVPTSGNSSKQSSPNTSMNGEMGPPNRTRKSNPKTTPKGNRSAENDNFAAATQEFLPLPVAQSKTPTTASTDAIYDLETQVMSTTTEGSAKQKLQSNTAVDSQDIWPTATPQKSVVAQVSVSDIRKNYELSSKKPKMNLKKRWLFESQQDSESDSDELSKSPAKTMLKSSSEKRKADKVETVTSESAKKLRTNQKAEDSPLTSAEVARIQKRRVSVVLERLKIDVNSNVSPASENDDKSPKIPKRSARQTKSNKSTDRTVSDATPNRATRASARTKV